MATRASDLLLAYSMQLKDTADKREKDLDRGLALLSQHVQMNFQEQEAEKNRAINILNKRLDLSNQKLAEVNDSLDTEIDALEDLTGQVFNLDDLNLSGNAGAVTNDIITGSVGMLNSLVADINDELNTNRAQLKEVKKQKKIANTIKDYYLGVGTSPDVGGDPERWDKEDFSLESLNLILKDRYPNADITDANAYIKGAKDIQEAKLAQNIIDANVILDQAKTAESQAIVAGIDAANTLKYNEFTQIEKDKLVLESGYGGLAYPYVKGAEVSLANAHLAHVNYASVVAEDTADLDAKKAEERAQRVADAENLYSIEVYNLGADITGVYLAVESDGTISDENKLTDEYNENLRVGKLILEGNNAIKDGFADKLQNPNAHINIVPYHNMIEELHFFLVGNDLALQDGHIDFEQHTIRERSILKYTGGMSADEVHNFYEQGEGVMDKMIDLNKSALSTQFDAEYEDEGIPGYNYRNFDPEKFMSPVIQTSDKDILESEFDDDDPLLESYMVGGKTLEETFAEDISTDIQVGLSQNIANATENLNFSGINVPNSADGVYNNSSFNDTYIVFGDKDYVQDQVTVEKGELKWDRWFADDVYWPDEIYNLTEKHIVEEGHTYVVGFTSDVYNEAKGEFTSIGGGYVGFNKSTLNHFLLANVSAGVISAEPYTKSGYEIFDNSTVKEDMKEESTVTISSSGYYGHYTRIRDEKLWQYDFDHIVNKGSNSHLPLPIAKIYFGEIDENYELEEGSQGAQVSRYTEQPYYPYEHTIEVFDGQKEHHYYDSDEGATTAHIRLWDGNNEPIEAYSSTEDITFNIRGEGEIRGAKNNVYIDRLTPFDYFPTDNQIIDMRLKADGLVDKILQEFADNKTTRKDENGVLYTVTFSQTMLDLQGYNTAMTRIVEKGMYARGMVEGKWLKENDAKKFVVGISEMFDHHFEDLNSNKGRRDEMWANALHAAGYTVNDVSEEFKYLFDEPKGYHIWATDKKLAYKSQWVNFTKEEKDKFNGSFEEFYKSYQQGATQFKNRGTQTTSGAEVIIPIYEALEAIDRA